VELVEHGGDVEVDVLETVVGVKAPKGEREDGEGASQPG
jgi:hypothetical protein